MEIISPCIIGAFLWQSGGWIRSKFLRLSFASLLVTLLSLYSLPLNNWGRAPYSSSYFGVNKSELSSYTNSLLILANEPLSYILPFFPNSNRIIGLPTAIPLTQKFLDSYLQPLHDYKKIYVVSLSDKKVFNESQNFLYSTFKIFIDKQSCKTYTPYSSPFVVCEARLE